MAILILNPDVTSSVGGNLSSVFKGQTSLIQMKFEVTPSFQYIDLVLDFWSSLPIDQIEIVRFIIANPGDNFPCVGMNPRVDMKYGSAKNE